MTHPVETLILHEAELLDEGKLEDWLSLYTEDASYWIPIDENIDPLKESSIIYDNKTRLAMRVEQILNQGRVAQTPRSMTMRMITNVQVEQNGELEANARFCLHLTEVRSGDWRQRGLGEMRIYPGRCSLQARLTNGKWQIAAKKIVLLNRHQPIVGLSFLI